MKLNISDFDKEILKHIIIEETERDSIIRKLYQNTVDHKLVSEKDMPYYEETLKMFDRKQTYFEQLINTLPNTDQIETSNEEELNYICSLIESQIEISRSRIEDFQPGQRIYERLAERTESKSEYEEGVAKIIQFENDCINCCERLKTLIPEDDVKGDVELKDA